MLILSLYLYHSNNIHYAVVRILHYPFSVEPALVLLLFVVILLLALNRLPPGILSKLDTTPKNNLMH
jgi:hypothetical protein